ncbi:MAG: FecR domain-containing protein [Hyphomicrobiales bacterium]|nr:FecR domain-containing protein [Hyphomicrobiales bacterium]
MRPLFALIVATTTILASATLPSFSRDQVGQATLIKTTVSGESGSLAVKSPVYQDERIRTSSSGLGEFRFADGTKFAVGGSSSVVIDRFIYDSTKTFDNLTLNAARGSFRWISGKSKSQAYKIVTPAGTIGIRGTRLDIFVGAGGITSVVLLEGAARFCGANGCKDLRRRCDVVVATPGGGVSDASRVNQSIFQTVGTDRAFPFLSGRQQLSNNFYGVSSNSCGLSSTNARGRTERGGGTDAPKHEVQRPDDGGYDDGGGCGRSCQ